MKTKEIEKTFGKEFLCLYLSIQDNWTYIPHKNFGDFDKYIFEINYFDSYSSIVKFEDRFMGNSEINGEIFSYSSIYYDRVLEEISKFLTEQLLKFFYGEENEQ